MNGKANRGGGKTETVRMKIFHAYWKEKEQIEKS
jgi:hypothetical protein